MCKRVCGAEKGGRETGTENLGRLRLGFTAGNMLLLGVDIITFLYKNKDP